MADPGVEVLLLVALLLTDPRRVTAESRWSRWTSLGLAVVEVSRTSSESSGWVPVFVDYLYLSVTNSSAFSPTDTMPLSSRAKLLVSIEATSALALSLLVIARAVGSLGG